MKIKVEELASVDKYGFETAGELEMVQLDTGGLINRGGRALPF